MHATTSRRMTRQRQIILDVLRQLTCHPTADELHQLVRKHLPQISIATVYRNLELLASEGLVLKLDLGGTQRRFDGTTENHYHIRCSVCGRVDDVPMEPIHIIEERVTGCSGYKVVSHRIEFSGICPDCAGKV